MDTTSPQRSLGLRDHLTHRGNLKHTRYGWLRLTPAYSLHVVQDLLKDHTGRHERVLDPFCGTGTTALACSEFGIPSDTTDINPFLIWLATTKTRNYSAEQLAMGRRVAQAVSSAVLDTPAKRAWVPPLHQIEKWWDDLTLDALSGLMAAIREQDVPPPVRDLFQIAFCRTLIDAAEVSFGHQSMSFKKKGHPTLFPEDDKRADIIGAWTRQLNIVIEAAVASLAIEPQVILCDARELASNLEPESYSCLITSPPYPNRMSYIRELRPYMYWLRFLSDGREAGELDWQAIGGTWGCATSNLAKWKPEDEREVPYSGFQSLVSKVAETSDVLARYLCKYFHDMIYHCREVHALMRKGGTVHYIVGNSKFYETIIPVQDIFVVMLKEAGFSGLSAVAIRKRTSKKELFEYLVTGKK